MLHFVVLKPRGRVTIFCRYCVLYSIHGMGSHMTLRPYSLDMKYDPPGLKYKREDWCWRGDGGPLQRGGEEETRREKSGKCYLGTSSHPPPFTHESYKFENPSKAIVISIVRAAQCRVQIRIKTGKLGFMVKTLQNVAFLFLKTVFLSGHFFCNLYFVTNVCSSTITNFW